MKRERDQSHVDEDAPNTKQSKLSTFLLEKADYHARQATTHTKIGALFQNLEKSRTEKYQTSDEDYSELSFDVVIHILEFFNFSCPIELSRLFLFGPLKKPTVEHFSHVSKIYFGFKTGMREDTRLLFPSITICDEGCDTMYNDSGEIIYGVHDAFLPFLPSGILAMSAVKFQNDKEIIDLTRFKRLKSYSDTESSYRIILLPDTVNYCESGAIKVEQLGNDIEGLQIQHDEDVPFKNLTKLKKFTNGLKYSLPESTYTTLLTNNLVYVDIIGTVVEIYPKFSISPTLHYLRVSNIVVQHKYEGEEFVIENNIRAFRAYRLLDIKAWKAMFKHNQLEDLCLLNGVDEQVASMITQNPNLAIFTIEANAEIVHKMLESPFGRQLVTLEILEFDSDPLKMAKIIQNTPKLNYLYIGKCLITPEDAFLIQSHPSLLELVVRECNTTDEVVEILLLSETLESISLGHTTITGTCLSVAQYNSTLKELHLYDCTLLKLELIYEYIAKNSTLTNLNLEGGPELDIDLWDALEKNTTLNSLFCPMNKSEHDAVVQNVLKYCPSLTKLSFINKD